MARSIAIAPTHHARHTWVLTCLLTVPLVLGLVACRPSRSNRGAQAPTKPRGAATPAPEAAPSASSAPSAKTVLSHADSALERIRNISASDRAATAAPAANTTGAPAPSAKPVTPQATRPQEPEPEVAEADAPVIGQPAPQPDKTDYAIYEAALGNYNNGRYDEAIGLFSEIVKTGRPPELVPNAYYWMGESFYATKRYEESLPYFEYVLRVGPQYKREVSLYKLARANKKLEHPEVARAYYERLRNEYPKSTYIATLKRLGVR